MAKMNSEEIKELFVQFESATQLKLHKKVLM
jgi:hypothetical protein